MRISQVRLAALLLLLCLLPPASQTVLANMAGPVREGSAVGEPSGDLKSIRIERETLNIDLRPLASNSPAIVEAIYKVRDDGDGRTIELIFVANAMTADAGGVWLDGQMVSSVSAGAQGLPESWQPPQTTPAIDGGAPLSYEVKRGGAIKFSLSLTPGQHQVRVRYTATATAHATANSPTVYWQLGYLLSPAREWASFGGLDAKVMLPAGWNAASNPQMKRNGDMLVGTWNELPADAIALTVQSPPGNRTPYVILRVLISIIGLGLCLTLGWMMGSRLGRRQRTSAWALPVSLVSGLIWGLALSLSYLAMMNAIEGKASGQASWRYGGYSDIFVGMLYFITIVPLGLVLTQLVAFMSSRREARRITQNV